MRDAISLRMLALACFAGAWCWFLAGLLAVAAWGWAVSP
jgi:hypothetical protein